MKTNVVPIIGILLMALSVGRSAELTFTQSAKDVDAYDFVEVTINIARPTAANPFTDAAVAGKFRCKEDEPIQVDGFCDSRDGSICPANSVAANTYRAPDEEDWVLL